MNLDQRIKEDIINAMKSKDKDTLNTLRAVKGAVQLEMLATKQDGSDDIYLDVLTKQIKMRNDSIGEFLKANRQDLIESYQREIDILKRYMPEELSEEEVNQIIIDIFNEINPAGLSDLGKIMKEITPKVKNKFDMKKLNEMIREKLSNI